MTHTLHAQAPYKQQEIEAQGEEGVSLGSHRNQRQAQIVTHAPPSTSSPSTP